MKTRLLFLFVPVLALAAGYFAWAPGDRSQDSEPITTAAAVANTTERTAPAEPAEPASPLIAASRLGESSCEIVTHYLPNGDGTVTEAYSCKPLQDDPGHPYESFSSAALESLAYSDAKAAEVLGMRLREDDEARAMSLVLRASALSGGDTAPIVRYSQAYPRPTAVNGKPVRKTHRVKFVLSVVTDLLGTDTYYAAPWEERIRQYSENPDREIEQLNDRALEIIQDMRRIQIDVTGTSTIGGFDDA